MAKGTIMFKNMANKFKVYLECKISDIKNIKELGIIEVLNRTKVIIISLISFMMIFGFILFNAINISEEEMLEDLKKSLITENSFKIAKIIRVRDEKISESEFKPLFNYYSGNEDKIKKLINELRKNGEYGNFEIKSKQGLFYKRYYIALDTVEVEFAKGTVPYIIVGPWAISEIQKNADFEWGITTIPTINGNQPVTFSGNIIACISSYTKNAEAAREVF